MVRKIRQLLLKGGGGGGGGWLDEPTAKNLVCKKVLPIPEKNWKNLFGGGIPSPSPPPSPLGHRRVKVHFRIFRITGVKYKQKLYLTC